MASFLSNPMASSPGLDQEERKKAVMENIRNELAIANAQELMNKTNEKCFAKCVTKPGASLSNSEQTCLGHCLDRYMETFTIVSRMYTTRISKERMQDSASAPEMS